MAAHLAHGGGRVRVDFLDPDLLATKAESGQDSPRTIQQKWQASLCLAPGGPSCRCKYLEGDDGGDVGR